MNQSEEAIAQLEQRLLASVSTSKDQLTTISRLQSELSTAQGERDSASQASTMQLKEKDKKVAALTEELEASLDKSALVERSLKEAKERLSKRDAKLVEASRAFKEMETTTRKLMEQKTLLNSQLIEAKEALAAQEKLAAALGSHVEAAKADQVFSEKVWKAKVENGIIEKEDEIASLRKQLRGGRSCHLFYI